MSSEVVIRAAGLGKCYRMYNRPEDRLKELIFPKRSLGRDFWALQDVDFEIRRGETIGLIGRNGSGKSTLLQLVCGTAQPTTGELEVHGRVAALLELGAGFNPDFTGRENVYLSATVLGLSEAEIGKRFPAIEAFAEIGEFIDQPVRKYSSGMYARLAFAVCAHVDADVLVVDEILAVGDVAFQQRCMRFFNAFRAHGTLLFVSHDESSVLSLCDRALWLDKGVLRSSGLSRDVCRQYGTFLAGKSGGDSFQVGGEATPPIPANADEVAPRAFDFDLDLALLETGKGIIEDARLLTPGGESLALAEAGSEVMFEVTAAPDRDVAEPVIGFVLRNALGQVLIDETTGSLSNAPERLEAGRRYRATFRFHMPFMPHGNYAVEPALFENGGATLVDRLLDHLIIRVNNDPTQEGLVNLFMHSTTLTFEQGAARREVGGLVASLGVLPAEDQRWVGKNRMEVTAFDGNAPWHGHGGVRVEDICFVSPDGQALSELQGGTQVELLIAARAERDIEGPIIGFMMRNALGQQVCGHNTFSATRDADRHAQAGDLMTARFSFLMPYLPKGDYTFAPSVIDGTQSSHVHLHWIEKALTVRVSESPVGRSVVGVAMTEMRFFQESFTQSFSPELTEDIRSAG